MKLKKIIKKAVIWFVLLALLGSMFMGVIYIFI